MTKKVDIIRVFEVAIPENDVNKEKEMERVKTMMNGQGMRLKYTRKENGNIVMGFFKNNLTKDVETVQIVEVSITGDKKSRIAEIARMRSAATSFYTNEVYCLEDDEKTELGFMSKRPQILRLKLEN